jgi:ankyrin repeat protein
LEKEERENLTVDIHAEENRRKAIIESEEFHLLRKLPTRREFANSKKKWYKGIHYPYNVDKGFPIVIQKKRDDLQDAKHYEKPYQAPVYNSDLILNGYYDQEKRYGNFMAETNYKKAEKYIQRNYYEEEKKKRKQEKLFEQQKLTRKRKGVMGVDITLDVTRAKYMATKEKLAFTVKLGEDNKDSRYNRSGVSNKDKRKKNIINFELEKIVADVRRGPKKKDIYRHEAMDSDEEELLNEEKRLTRQKLAKGGGGGGEEEEGEEKEDGEEEEEDESESDEESEEQENDGDGDDEGGERVGNDDGMDEEINVVMDSPKRSPTLLLSPLLTSFPSFFRAASSTIFPESATNTSPSSPSKKKSKSASLQFTPSSSSSKKLSSKRSFREAFTRYNPLNLDKEDFLYFYEDSKKAIQSNSVVRFITKSRKLTEPYKTATVLKKEKAMHEMISMGEVLSHPKYLEERMELADHELTIEEFKYLTTRKKREFKQQMKILDRKNASQEDKHQLALIKKRDELLEEMIVEREQRFEQSKQLIETMKNLLEQQYSEIQELEETKYEKYEKYWMNKLFYTPLKGKKMPTKMENLLPDPAAPEKQTELVEYLVRLRIFERNQVAKSRRMYYRVVRLGQSIEDLEDRMDREKRAHTADDLLFACQAGDYKRVIDIIDPREAMDDRFSGGIVGINDISSDGMTATFATLSMILNQEVLDTEANYDDLFLTDFQKARKKALKYVGFSGKKKKLANVARFDYLLQILLHYGGDLNFPKMEFGKDGLTIFHLACQQGAIELVKWLLKKGVDINQLSLVNLRTPLMFAVERDHLELMLLLLKEGAVLGIHHVDQMGNNILHYASLYARPLIVQILLICGVKSNVRNKSGFLPSEEARMKGRLEISTTILTFRDDIIDHLQRIDYLMRNLNVPFDYHTGKGPELGAFPSNLDGMATNRSHPHHQAAPEIAFPQPDDEEGEQQQQSVPTPGVKNSTVKDSVIEEQDEEDEDVFPVDENNLTLDNNKNNMNDNNNESPSETMSPSLKRMNSLWAAVQKRTQHFRNAYSSPEMSLTEHLEQVKQDHSRSTPNSRFNLPMAAISSISSVIGPVLAGDGKTRRERQATPNADMALKAPTLRRTLLQLNFSYKTKDNKPTSLPNG